MLASSFHCQTKESCAQLLHMPAGEADGRLITALLARTDADAPISYSPSARSTSSCVLPTSRTAQGGGRPFRSDPSLPWCLISGRQDPHTVIWLLEAEGSYRKPKSQISQPETHLMFDISILSVISSSCTVWMRADTNRLERSAPMCA